MYHRHTFHAFKCMVVVHSVGFVEGECVGDPEMCRYGIHEAFMYKVKQSLCRTIFA